MKGWFSAYTCRDRAQAEQKLAAWYGEEPGRTLAGLEQEQVASIVANLFGYHLLQLGDIVPCDLLAASRIRHRMVMTRHSQGNDETRHSEGVRFVGEPDQLPIGNDAIDVVLCPHVLEFAASPHQVLREIERVLIPEGHVVIVGFNPWSLWGVWRLLTGWRRQVPWCGRFYGSARIRDWLALLGFDTLFTRTLFFRPPISHSRLQERLGFVEQAGSRWWHRWGGVHIVVAKKRVATLTPIKPRWRPRRSLLPGKLAEPTMRRKR